MNIKDMQISGKTKLEKKKNLISATFHPVDIQQ